MGIESSTSQPRLFNNVTSNFIVVSWQIARHQYPDNREIIAKVGNKYIVLVEEERKSWCNAGPCAGTYSFESTAFLVFEILRNDSKWMMDKYYFLPASPQSVTPKYEGLMF